jgi:acyl-coenzyme A thioesterase PaaI-like protein
VIVAFAAGIDMDALELQIDPQSKMENLTNVPRGGLIIAFVDSQSGFVIWLGVATADIQEQPDTKTVKARLEFAVTQLLQMFPK